MTRATRHHIVSAIAGIVGGICLSMWINGGTELMLLMAMINAGLSVFNAYQGFKASAR